MIKKVLFLILVLSLELSMSQVRFGRGIKLYNAEEIQSFDNGYNYIPVSKKNGYINKYIHFDKLVSNSSGLWINGAGSNSIKRDDSSVSSGISSLSTGVTTFANGDYSTAIGKNVYAPSYCEVALGVNGTLPKVRSKDKFNEYDRIFSVGNGKGTDLSNALVILKNGKITAPSYDISEIDNPKSLITKEYADANYLSGGGSANLSYKAGPTQGEIVSSSGTNAIIPVVSSTNAGLQKPNFYEEKDFTPTMTTSAYKVKNSRGKSIRIGNLVYFSMQLTITQNGESSFFNIRNLPYKKKLLSKDKNFSITIRNSNLTEDEFFKLTGILSDDYFVIAKFTDNFEGEKALEDLEFISGKIGYIEISGSYITDVY